jgi:glycosyltransferase involved in cell wall biosynthesis
MNILIFSKHFWPENFKINIIAEELVKRKNEVDVITCHSNYNNNSKLKNYKKFFFIKKKKWKNINIYYLPVYKKKNYNGINIFIEYFSFFISSFFFLFFFLRKKYNIIFVFGTSPILQALPVICYSKLKKIPLVLWVQDLWPESLIDTNYIKSSLILNFIKSLVRIIYANSSLILVQSAAFIKNIKINFNIKNKILVYYNPAENKFSKFNVNKNKKKIITYAGNFGNAQDFETIKLCLMDKTLNENILFYFIGSGKKISEFKDFILKNDLLYKVKIIDYLDPKFLYKYLLKSDAFFLTLKSGFALNLTIPGKFQTYISFGKPIIANCDGVAYELIKKNNLGFVNKPDDYLQLVKNLNKLSNLSIYNNKIIYKNINRIYNKLFNKTVNINLLEKYFLLQQNKLSNVKKNLL